MLSITPKFRYCRGIHRIWIQKGMKLREKGLKFRDHRCSEIIRSAKDHGPRRKTVSRDSSEGKINWNLRCSTIRPRTNPTRPHDLGRDATKCRRFCFCLWVRDFFLLQKGKYIYIYILEVNVIFWKDSKKENIMFKKNSKYILNQVDKIEF